MNNLASLLQVQFFCSKHPKMELNFGLQEIENGTVSYRHADLRVTVDPCPECQWEYEQFKRSVEIIIEQKNEQ